MIFGIDLDGLFDLTEDTQYQLTVFIVVLALMFGFALTMAVIARVKRSPVEKIVARRRAF